MTLGVIKSQWSSLTDIAVMGLLTWHTRLQNLSFNGHLGSIQSKNLFNNTWRGPCFQTLGIRKCTCIQVCKNIFFEDHHTHTLHLITYSLLFICATYPFTASQLQITLQYLLCYRERMEFLRKSLLYSEHEIHLFQQRALEGPRRRKGISCHGVCRVSERCGCEDTGLSSASDTNPERCVSLHASAIPAQCGDLMRILVGGIHVLWQQQTNSYGLQKSCGAKGTAWPLSK